MLCQVIIGIACLYILSLTTTPYRQLPEAHGHTSTIYLLSSYANVSDPAIVKSIHPHFAPSLFDTEKKVYERFSADENALPQGILGYYGVHEVIPSGLVLEFAEKGNLMEWLWKTHTPPSEEMVFKWVVQAAEALAFAHRKGIFHGDIHLLNFFLTEGLDVKVGDWGGAAVDGAVSKCSYRVGYRLLTENGTDVVATSGVSVQTELFAFGMAVWSLVSGEEVWAGLENEEIKERIVDGRFPDTSKLKILSSVVERCWSGGFGSMEEVRAAVEVERDGWLDRNRGQIQQVL